MLATYMWRMGNNNVEIRIAGSSFCPQWASCSFYQIDNCISSGIDLTQCILNKSAFLKHLAVKNLFLKTFQENFKTLKNIPQCFEVLEYVIIESKKIMNVL